MLAKLISLENGKGIILPTPVLEKCHIHDDVDLEIENDAIIIRPIRKKPRLNWEQAFMAMHTNGDDRLLIDDGLDWEDFE